MINNEWFKEDDYSNPKEVMKALAEVIEYHNELYYVLNDPVLPDVEFDRLWNRLLELEARYPSWSDPLSPTQKVSGRAEEGQVKVRHAKPMLSIGKAFEEQDVLDFEDRARKTLGLETVEYACEPKFDGLATSLVYEHGLLVQGATRGDGEVGEDVTANVRVINDIPKDITAFFKEKNQPVPSRLEVRGEVYMSKTQFKALQDQQAARGEKVAPNPRNAAAGALKLLDTSLSKKRGLSFFAYALGVCEGWESANTHAGDMALIKEMGFPVCPLGRVVKNAEGLMGYFKEIGDIRDQLNYDIDGVVYKINDYKLQEQWGYVSSAPRFVLAHKFPAAEVLTVVEDIVVQIGRTGKVTPVAKVKPVFVGGVMVSSAVLHNFDDLARRDVRVGDTVWIRRAGDVIPEIAKVVLEKRKPGAVLMKAPTSCPVCGSVVTKKAEEADVRCSGGVLCGAQNRRILEHFASRDNMAIQELGEETIELLVSRNLVNTVDDFYQLKKEDLLKLPRMAEKSVDNLLNAIEKSKDVELYRFIAALGIHEVGISTAKILAQHFGQLSALKNATEEELIQIKAIGEVTAKNICQYFKNPINQRIINNLIEYGVRPRDVEKKEESECVLKNMTFVVTGTLPGVDRNSAKASIEMLGGKVSGSVSKKTNVVIAGEEAGSNLKKAQDLGVKVMSWNDYLTWVEGLKAAQPVQEEVPKEETASLTTSGRLKMS